MKKIKTIVKKGKIVVKTGLHVGGAKSALEIGSLDLPVIKNPLGVPYIPGSSLKGAVLSRLAAEEGSKSKGSDSPLLQKLFGSPDEKSPTRLLFRDCPLDEQHFHQTFSEQNAVLETDFTEAKWENTIDRVSGTAQHPRQIERVPAGAQFDYEIVLGLYEGDNEEEMQEKLRKGLDLLEKHYLGGSGSRGYGKVEILPAENV